MAQASFDRDQVRVWLEQLHGDSAGFLHICSTGNFAGATVDMSDVDWTTKAAYYIENLDRTGAEGIYLRATTVARRLDPGERGGAKDSMTFPGFWADIDLKGPGHKHEVCPADCDKRHKHQLLDLPETEEDARKIIEASGLPEPTLWIHSGGGMYPWWLLRDAEHVTADNLGHLQGMSELWQRVIAHSAKELGFEYGAEVYDLARVLRIPGTVNRKAGLERQCRILEGNSGKVYSYEGLCRTVTAQMAKIPQPEPEPRPAPRVITPGSGISPLDDFEARTDWADILEPLGWTYAYQQGQTRYWVRPGKRAVDGVSATTGHETDRDRLYLFSTSVGELEPLQCHTKQYVYAAYHHAGNMSEAASSLRGRGFGEQRVFVSDDPITIPAPFDLRNSAPVPQVPEPEAQQQVPDLSMFEYSDKGNGQRMQALFPNRFRYCNDKKKWAVWQGDHWDFKHDTDEVKYWVGEMTSILKRQAGAMGEEGEKLAKWATTSGSDTRQNSAVSQLRTRPGISALAKDFDSESKFLNLRNGTLNLDSGELLPHDPKRMLSMVFGASYRPDATADRWRRFMEEVLPDEEIRKFVQRMAGYSLLGKPNRRAMALLSGPPGTGKSKFVETLTSVFGDYGGTAAASLFRAKKGDNTSTVELHALRGKRFVATSESAEEAKLDEELIKRLSGQDSVTSRGLYEAPQTWSPQAVMWMATNHNPRINPDDPAAWGRVKVVEFGERFEGRVSEDPELLDKLLAEADGILNWLLEGLAMFREDGVEAPQSVKDAGEKYRTENDTALQFLDMSLAEESLSKTPGAELIKAHLYTRYTNWCEANKFNALGQIKFNKRVRATGVDEEKRNGQLYWIGLSLNMGSGLLGHMTG